ncbi:MAG: peptidoglycan editing factor PgeF [Gammaproteobacteria bacterium]|nr:peptidoglycan editing factor PgeF [Gammaproteobacteria bacterium]
MASKVCTLSAAWPAPARVHAITTLRQGGVSAGPYSSLNLADHVGDCFDCVCRNREVLRQGLKLPREPTWLNQIHGVEVVNAAEVTSGVCADGSYTSEPGVVCAILTADCLPLFMCDRSGDRVSLVHVGWRGLAGGIVERAVSVFVSSATPLAWMGPAIGPRAYEVGRDVYNEFAADDPEHRAAFTPSIRKDYWLADLYALTRLRLQRSGVTQICGGEVCTYTEEEHFFSYRRDRRCGRMASLIWIE